MVCQNADKPSWTTDDTSLNTWRGEKQNWVGQQNNSFQILSFLNNSFQILSFLKILTPRCKTCIISQKIVRIYISQNLLKRIHYQTLFKYVM